METEFGKDSIALLTLHTKLLSLHVKALGAHCECLAMNAENCVNTVRNEPPTYADGDFHIALTKWGLTDDKGNPIPIEL